MKIRYSLQQQRGYILLLLMLLIGSLGLYLSYKLATQKTEVNSWQLQKTATEISYWMDAEYNYAQDHGILENQNGMNQFSLMDLITNAYLPYGQSRYVTAPSTSIPQVSEFMCSPLPGITGNDGALQLSPPTINPTCPTYDTSHAYCNTTPDTPAYYACSTTVSANTTANIAKAQYYINANNIALGNISSILAGIGLIIRTPGLANPHVTFNGGQMGSLPNNSVVQSLISLLPTSSFDVYSTNSNEVNGVGIGTYIYDTGDAAIKKNDTYSKIIDMGLVQPVDPTALPTNCCGWSNGKKTGAEFYNGTSPCRSGTTASVHPPVCIQIDTTKFGPSGSVEHCDRIDVLYTMFSDSQPLTSPADNYWFLNYTNTVIATDKTDGKYKDIYLSMHSDAFGNTGRPQYLFNNITDGTNYLAYLVRCTRNKVP